MKATFALACLMALPLPAAAMDLHRGLNLEIWREWLSVDDILAQKDFLAVYPDWRRDIGPKRYALAKSEGFDFIRIPLDPAPLLALGPGAAQDALIGQMRQVADQVVAAGLTAVVDMHAFPRPGEKWGTEQIVGPLWPDYVALVGRVAAALNGLDPALAAFEPLNEPTNDCDAIWGDQKPQWPDQLQQMHDAARKGAPDLPLVLSGACWGGIDGLVAVQPEKLHDDNIIWSFHSYEPFAFTHQSANWTSGAMPYIAGIPYPPSALDEEQALTRAAQAALRMQAETGTADIAAIASLIANYRAMDDDFVYADPKRAAAWADAHNIAHNRLLLGEFGAVNQDFDGPINLEWQRAFLTQKRSAAEEHGIGWAVWSFSGTMAVTDDIPGHPINPNICVALGMPSCAP